MDYAAAVLPNVPGGHACPGTAPRFVALPAGRKIPLSYNWRRFDSSAAGCLDMSPYQKACLSGWKDVQDCGAGTGQVPVNVGLQYDETKLINVPVTKHEVTHLPCPTSGGALRGTVYVKPSDFESAGVRSLGRPLGQVGRDGG